MTAASAANHTSPCPYAKAIKWFVIALIVTTGGVWAFVLTQVSDMQKKVELNSTATAEAGVRFQYIADTLDEIKAKLK